MVLDHIPSKSADALRSTGSMEVVVNTICHAGDGFLPTRHVIIECATKVAVHISVSFAAITTYRAEWTRWEIFADQSRVPCMCLLEE
jgi:hypothetical protein